MCNELRRQLRTVAAAAANEARAERLQLLIERRTETGERGEKRIDMLANLREGNLGIRNTKREREM